MKYLEVCTQNLEQTHALGEKIGRAAQKNMVFLLDGDLGAGKTTLTQGIAKGLDIRRNVTSPTFTILKIYQGRMPLYHIDAYRLEGTVQDLGFEELMEDAPHEGPWVYEQISLGYNYRLTDFQAAMLLSQLQKLEGFKARRQAIVKKYDEAFSEIPEIIVQKEIPESDTCRHLYIIRLDLSKLNCSRRQFFDAMSAENVQCQIHYVPTYFFPYYRHLGYQGGLCPNAEEVYKGIMSIPLYPALTDADTDDVIHAVKKIVEYYRK